jgi:hypothetical protein
MITKAQLEENNFRNLGGDLYYYGTYDYCFNIKTQELSIFNESTGDKDFLCNISDIDKLNDLIGFLGANN